MKDVCWHAHGELITAIEGLEFGTEIDSALFVLPRGSLKSSICSVGAPIWLLNRNPNRRILLDSAVYDLSTQFVSEISQHFVSGNLTDLYGTYKTRDDWSSKSITIAQRTQILKESSVVASGVGAAKTGSHFDWIISDDLNNEKNSATPELREKVWKHFQMGAAILEPGGKTMVVATRYSADDVPGRILSEFIGDDHLPGYLKAN